MDLEQAHERMALHRQQQSEGTKINMVLDDLYGIVVETTEFISLWKQIHSLIRTRVEVAELLNYILFTTGKLLLDRAVLDISKIFDKGKDSINHEFLTNLIRNEGRKTISDKALTTLKSKLAHDEQALQVHSALIAQMKTKRDKEIAHLDKSMLGNVFDHHTNVEVDEIESVLALLDSLYVDYYDICGFKKRSNAKEDLTMCESAGFVTDFDRVIRVVDFALDKAAADEQDDVIKSLQFGRMLSAPFGIEYIPAERNVNKK